MGGTFLLSSISLSLSLSHSVQVAIQVAVQMAVSPFKASSMWTHCTAIVVLSFTLTGLLVPLYDQSLQPIIKLTLLFVCCLFLSLHSEDTLWVTLFKSPRECCCVFVAGKDGLKWWSDLFIHGIGLHIQLSAHTMHTISTTQVNSNVYLSLNWW